MPDFVDVLPLLNKAAVSLRDNEVIQSENISLFETTSAIEIGEPRMDTGVYTEEELRFPQLDVLRPLLPSEILYVMESMLSLEMKWFQGFALAQTVFTCKYVHSLDELELEDIFSRRAPDSSYLVQLMTSILRSFMRGVLKTCDLVTEEMLKRHIYDNEDFVADKAGVDLLENVEIDTVLDDINEAISILLEWTGDDAMIWRMPLLTHLRIQSELLCSVCLFMFDTPMYERVEEHTSAARQALQYLRRPQPPSTPVSGAVNPYLGKHLDTLAPPRPSLALLNHVETFQILDTLLDDIDGAVSLTRVNDWMSIEKHFLQLSRRKDAVPYIQSLHQSVFYQDRAFCGYRDLSWIGRHLFNDYAGCTNEIWEFIENYNDLDSGQMSIIHRFIGLTGQAGWRLLDYITFLGKNRSRQYRKLPRLLQPLAFLEKQASALQPILKDLLNQYEVPHDTLRLTKAFQDLQAFLRVETILVGFDLELYSVEEFPAIYWYMSEVTREGVITNYKSHDLGNSDTACASLLASRARLSQIYHHLALATCAVLVLAGIIPAATALNKAIFTRRFSWAYQEEASGQPDWLAFVAHFDELAAEPHARLGDKIRAHCAHAAILLDIRIADATASELPLFSVALLLIVPFQTVATLLQAYQSLLSASDTPQEAQRLLKSPLSYRSPFPVLP